jgi:hypothetical protein
MCTELLSPGVNPTAVTTTTTTNNNNKYAGTKLFAGMRIDRTKTLYVQGES